MAPLVQIGAGDAALLGAVDAAMAEAVQRGGDWVVCRPGCTQCCLGPFEITQLDALRLREGLRKLETAEPARAAAVRSRAEAYVALAGPVEDPDRCPPEMDDAACPALDPGSGLCDLYEARPIMCRTFGPATRSAGGLYAICELCYRDAPDEDVRRCAVEVDPDGMEAALLAGSGLEGTTMVAVALTREARPSPSSER